MNMTSPDVRFRRIGAGAAPGPARGAVRCVARTGRGALADGDVSTTERPPAEPAAFA